MQEMIKKKGMQVLQDRLYIFVNRADVVDPELASI
jgi:hypothetical protein